MNDDANYVMDEAFAATHDGISQEAWINSEKDSSPETVTDFFVKPASENHEQYGASGDRYGGECERAYNHSTREPTMLGLKDSLEMPPHRYLFHCYVYQYHLIQMGRIIIQMVCLLFFSSLLSNLIARNGSSMRYCVWKLNVRNQNYGHLLRVYSIGRRGASPIAPTHSKL